MRKLYLDNIRWITVTIVVLYHVLYIFNGAQTFGVIGPFHEHQLQDAFLYMVYPWFMALLFVVSGMSAKYYLERGARREEKMQYPNPDWGYGRLDLYHTFELL